MVLALSVSIAIASIRRQTPLEEPFDGEGTIQERDDTQDNEAEHGGGKVTRRDGRPLGPKYHQRPARHGFVPPPEALGSRRSLPGSPVPGSTKPSCYPRPH